ncbi:MAG: TonB-dependent receptor [Saprospiraceae bacterium]|nr:TonB-dependent receptor [Saprospiraceae bacterium]MDZ4703080.1 TonB-dependent receptor [Saprospiraceae bacterium]
MKSCLLLLLAIISFSSLYAQGILTGVVLDEDGLSMPGATIYIGSLDRGAVTDVNGKYFFSDLKSGTYTLAIAYIGYQSVKQEAIIEEGKTTTLVIRLSSGVQLIDEILILGDRLKGQAKALNQQKNNINVTNIVAADQIGRFPDANTGDALKRIPGITIQGDQGEARNILIRGFAPQLNAVRINGERVPSAEGDNRNVQLDLIPSDMIQTIEVNKTLTPDMEADALGGAVNLITRAAPSGLRLSGTLASGLNLLSNKPIWTGTLIAGDRFAGDKLGVIVSGTINDHNFGSDNIEMVWANEVESPLTEEDIEVDPFLEEIDVRQYEVRRQRRSLSASVDYKLSANHTLYLQGMYNWRDDWENRFRLTFEDIEPVFEEGTETITGYTAAASRQVKAGSSDSDGRRLETQRTQNYSLRGDHLFGKLRLDWQASYATASEEKKRERYIKYASDDAYPVIMDVSDPMFPNVTPVDAADFAASKFELDELTEENGFTEEKDFNFRADFSLPTQVVGRYGAFKFGGRTKIKDKIRDNDFFEYSPLSEQYDLLDKVGLTDATKDNFLPGSQYVAGVFPSAEFIGGLNLADPNQFEGEAVPGEYLPGNYEVNETVSAGYILWNQQLTDRLTVLAGLRVENTQIEYTGNQVLDEEELIGEVTAEKSYTNVLPGLHLKYDISDNFSIRAAWTNTLARPNYYDLVPFQNIIAEDEEIQAGNSNLEPTRASNLDLMLERYFSSVGLLSAGAFYKKVDDFIYTAVDESYVSDITNGDEWTFFQPLNGGSADVYGFEIALQRQLDFLPGALKGLGVYLNYTYTGSSAKGIRNGDGEEREGLDLPGAVPHLFNASLSFETKRLVLRLSANYADDYIDEVGDNDFTDRYYDRQFFLDANGSYALTKRLRIFVDANNLTNQPLRYYQGIRSRTQQAEYYNARFNVGLKFDFFGNKE